MKAIRYNIRLLEPLLIRTDGSDPNTMSCAGYIPGSAIRGALIAQYQRLIDSNPMCDSTVARRLFFSDQTCFLNAYPLTTDRSRTVPTPLSFKIRKYDRDSLVYDELAMEDETDDQLKPLPYDFCKVDTSNDRIIGCNIERSRSVHIDRKRDSDTGEANVFNIETMNEGQTLSAFLIARNAQDIELMEELLRKIASIGTGKGGGHGRVQIEEISPQNKEVENLEAETLSEDPERVVITLTAHAIWRNAEGLLVNNAGSAEEFLGELIGENVTVSSAHAKLELMGGFNRKWRLPLPGEYAICPGSVFVIESPHDSCRKKLVELCRTGIGERRNEGFGRFCIDAHGRESEYQLSTQSEIRLERKTISSDSPAYETAKLLVDQMTRHTLERKVRRYIENLSLESGLSSKSQINSLRNATEALLSQQTTGEEAGRHLQDHLTAMLNRQHSRDQLEKLKVNKQKLRDWLRKNISLLSEGDSNELCQSLELSPESLPEIGGVKASLSHELVTLTRLQIIHEVMVGLAR